MAQWYVKELSSLTGVSVQTLHHYDRIGLLKPSLRLPNNYRVYSEKDLLRLQQIIALKYFGFELSEINGLLSGTMPVYEHLQIQAKILQRKAKSLLETSRHLESIISNCSPHESIPWQTLIEIIEVYNMTQNTEHAWAVEVLTPEELKQYAQFEAELKSNSSPEDKQRFTEKWLSLVDQARNNLDKDPKSDFSRNLAQEVMNLVCGLYGRKHANLRYSIWEKGFKKGKMDGDRAIEPEIIEWLDQAIDHYWRETIYDLLNQVGKSEDSKLRVQWNKLMDEMYGDSENLKLELIEAAMLDPRVSSDARLWLKIKK